MKKRRCSRGLECCGQRVSPSPQSSALDLSAFGSCTRRSPARWCNGSSTCHHRVEDERAPVIVVRCSRRCSTSPRLAADDARRASVRCPRAGLQALFPSARHVGFKDVLILRFLDVHVRSDITGLGAAISRFASACLQCIHGLVPFLMAGGGHRRPGGRRCNLRSQATSR